MQRVDLVCFVVCSFCDALQGLELIVDQKLTVGLEEWQALVLIGNGLNGPSPTDIPLVQNKREKYEVVLTSVC